MTVRRRTIAHNTAKLLGYQMRGKFHIYAPNGEYIGQTFFNSMDTYSMGTKEVINHMRRVYGVNLPRGLRDRITLHGNDTANS